jgi:hypothetical protein
MRFLGFGVFFLVSCIYADQRCGIEFHVSKRCEEMDVDQANKIESWERVITYFDNPGGSVRPTKDDFLVAMQFFEDECYYIRIKLNLGLLYSAP